LVVKPLGPALSSDSRVAYLFCQEGTDVLGVALDPEGSQLPREDGATWIRREHFWLGVHEPLPFEADPEPILRGIQSRGYFTWRAGHPCPFGTSQ
jgi:hypothetical protein